MRITRFTGLWARRTMVVLSEIIMETVITFTMRGDISSVFGWGAFRTYGLGFSTGFTFWGAISYY